MEKADLMIKYCVESLTELREEMILQTTQMNTALKTLQQAQAAVALKTGGGAVANGKGSSMAMHARGANKMAVPAKKLTFVESVLHFMNNGPVSDPVSV